uniref:Uncharacterized protein n=1 Tax=Schizaphis graminum TaxID=13262 RepID=A0A2S2NCT3_SCHGA
MVIDLQEEVDKQMATLEEKKSALQMKIEEFESRNQRERNELELLNKELKRSMKAFEDGRKTWEREKKSETQYIESRKQELEVRHVMWLVVMVPGQNISYLK